MGAYDQILPNTFEHTLNDLIEEHIDLSAFHSRYKNDDQGRVAYDPAILLKIILYAYRKGITSSREIQHQCETNIIFKALSCDTVPHFTRIASFVSGFSEAIQRVFEEVLLVCDQQGLLGHELIAIDGFKLPSDASKAHSGTLPELEDKLQKIRIKIKHCVAEHERLDSEGQGDSELAKRQQQKRRTLEKHVDKIKAFLEGREPRMGKGKKPKEVKSNITDNESAKMKTGKGTIQGYNGIAAVDKKHQIVVSAEAYGEGQEQHTLQPMLESIDDNYEKAGIKVDLRSKKVVVTADTGFSNEDNDRFLMKEEYNAVIPDGNFRSRDPAFDGQKKKHGKRHQDEKKTTINPDDFFKSSDFTIDVDKKTCVCPADKSLLLKAEVDRGDQKVQLKFEGRLTDCRHCPLKTQCMRRPESADHRHGHGRQISKTFTTGKTATDLMKERVDSPEGKAIYAHRMSVVEPVFGNITSNKGLNRFSLRGKTKVNGQWRLFCLVHNIEKLANYGKLAA